MPCDYFTPKNLLDLAVTEPFSRLRQPMNDDKSPLVELMSCIVCCQPLKSEKIVIHRGR